MHFGTSKVVFEVPTVVNMIPFGLYSFILSVSKLWEKRRRRRRSEGAEDG